MLKIIDKIYSDCKRDDDLISIVLKLKIQYIELRDKFSMSKDLMIEVEELANQFTHRDDL
jgi:hypothetical protein